MMTRRSLSILLLPMMLAGCAPMKPAANVADLRGEVPSQALAEDAVLQLSKIFPPAKTQLYFTRATIDAFGHAFVAGLREMGYAVQEAAVNPMGDQSYQSSLPVAYIVAPMVGDEGYRLSLTVGGGVLSRAYSVQQDGTLVGGVWAYRE